MANNNDYAQQNNEWFDDGVPSETLMNHLRETVDFPTTSKSPENIKDLKTLFEQEAVLTRAVAGQIGKDPGSDVSQALEVINAKSDLAQSYERTRLAEGNVTARQLVDALTQDIEEKTYNITNIVDLNIGNLLGR